MRFLIPRVVHRRINNLQPFKCVLAVGRASETVARHGARASILRMGDGVALGSAPVVATPAVTPKAASSQRKTEPKSSAQFTADEAI
jgi:hypothetical protein